MCSGLATSCLWTDFQVTLVKNRPSEDGSENGSDEGDLENNNSVFPLDQNALARIHFVKALKPAQVRAISEVLLQIRLEMRVFATYT